MIGRLSPSWKRGSGTLRILSNTTWTPASAPVLARGFFAVINQGEIAYREFLGRNRIRLEPGLRLRIPILHNLSRVDLRERGIEVEEIIGYTKDNVPVRVSGTLFIQVENAEKACFAVADYVSAVRAIGESCMRSILGRFDYDTLTSERNEINAELRKVIGQSIHDWGTSCTRFEIQTMSPANPSVTDELEAQMRAERSRRENELNVRASINTAEGEKRAQILKSEGKLQATKNEADAERYRVEAQTRAMVDQISRAREALPSASCAEVMDYLLETQRLQNLKAVANGANKQIYFLDPRLEVTNMITKRGKVVADVLSGKP